MAATEVEEVSDVASGWTRIVRRSLPRAEARVAGGRTRIKVEVAATWPTPLPGLVAAVHERVAERVSTLTGMAVDGVDVTVHDVVHHVPEERRVE